MQSLLIKQNNIILISLFLALIAALFSSSPMYLLILLVLVPFIIKLFHSEYLPALIIISYLSITSEFFQSIRSIINIFSTLLLVYLFLKRFGLDYLNYPTVPKKVIYFMGFLFGTLFISTIFSSGVLISSLATLRTIFFFIIVYLFYSLTSTEASIQTIIFSLFLVMIIIGIPMLVDLYSLGIQNYFIRVLLSEKVNLHTSKGYTGMTLLFISSALIVSMFFIDKLKKNRYGIILFLLMIFNIISLILANSRGGILASIISVGFILFMLKRAMFVKIFIAVSTFLILIYIFVPSINEAVNFYMRWETVSDRGVYWQMGVDIIKDHPVFGIGPDLFDKYFFDYAPSKTVNYFMAGDLSIGKPHPHNFFLYFTAENGVLGFLTVVTFFIMFFYFAIKTIRLTKDKSFDYYVLAIAITGIGIGIFFRSFIEVTGFLIYGYITRDLPFWLMFVIVVTIYQKFKNSEI